MTLDLREAAISSPELDLEAAVAAQAAVIVELRVVIAGTPGTGRGARASARQEFFQLLQLLQAAVS